ncbi:nitrilase-related carbon-nitrogen hydrolase [Conexibacter woesei]|uniref:Nitrilase/cyanide hydratase and apolipoprotein N-acyltransferase n=1 Tax=Conexibacter woesei (strain DSM 14684 / CCUG 47730 / CIP 108061 / JCM 11494 / NBRC 100937 / ID131577) TaxID=469383 RepID=D3F3E2_CONWI|nr:nitrilase-related carbon-nitrogen hydrolase [Conexibacter woesei]ADB52307.1 Nitrilase/cyanide hydratase and apolipoprotein N- acyltransferase [Conexibacter woesei DSM 14684]
MPRIATVQLEPSYMDPAAGLERIRRFTADAAADGAELVVFPELLVPGYPRYVPDPFPHTEEGRQAWSDIQRYHRAYLEHSQQLPGPFTQQLGEIARTHGCALIVGVSELHPTRRACIYNSAVAIDRDGTYRGKRRKLVAVMHERLYFTRGGREDLRTFELGGANVGIAICFENHHPQIRRALGELGEEIHCALWTGPTPRAVAADGGRHEQHREIAVAHALDTGAFVVTSSQVTDREPDGGQYGSNWAHSGGSYIVDPLGRTLASVPDWEEGIAIADCDLAQIDVGRLVWNPFGDDLRDDLFASPFDAAPLDADG